jgi:hypothetical protein
MIGMLLLDVDKGVTDILVPELAHLLGNFIDV